MIQVQLPRYGRPQFTDAPTREVLTMRATTRYVLCSLVYASATLHLPTSAEPEGTVDLNGTWRFSASDDPRFAQVKWDDSGWLEVEAPKPLKGQHADLESGNGWYRRTFLVGFPSKGRDLIFTPGGISGTFSVYFNGQLVGNWLPRVRQHRFLIPAKMVKAPGENVIAVRVKSRDGMQSGKIALQPADEKARHEVLATYVKASVGFEVHVPPLASSGEKQVQVRVTIENPAPFNPVIDNAAAELVLRRPKEEKEDKDHEPISRKPLRLAPGKKQNFELSASLGSGAWEAALLFGGEAVHARQFLSLSYLDPHSGIKVDPHSLWVKDANDHPVTLFAGPAPQPALTSVKRKQPTILNLTSQILWDDYYLPERKNGHFVEQFARDLRGGAEVVDACFQGLPLLLLPEVHRIVSAARPDVVVLSVGEHEHYFSPSPEDSEQAFDAVIRALKSATTARLVLVVPPPALKHPEIGKPFEEATRRLAERHGLRLLDTPRVFAARGGGLAQLYDRLCPNEKAHGLIAEELAKLLPRKEIKDLLKREEYSRSELPAEGKSLVLIDGRMPNSTEVAANAQWGQAAGKAAHWHETGKRPQSEHYFVNGDPILVPPGSKLIQEVLLDPKTKPSAIMLVFRTILLNRDAQGLNYFHKPSHRHGVFWGGEDISYGKGKTGQPERINGGALPQAAGWTRLTVDASAVDLAGRYLNSIRFVTHGGTARWGRTLLRTPDGEQTYVDGAFPMSAGRGRDWQWVPAPRRPGKLAHRTVDLSAERKYSFRFIRRVPLVDGARLRQRVYLRPGQEPSRIGLTAGSGGPWHYWGRLKAYDQPGRSWIYHGPMPASGRWTQLDVPLGATLDGIGFLTWTGAALWGATEVVGADPEFELGGDFSTEHMTSISADAGTIGTTAMGNQYFLGQTPTFLVAVNNAGPDPGSFKGRLELRDTYEKPVTHYEVQCELPPEGLGLAEVPCSGLGIGFYRVRLLGADSKELCSTTMSILPRHVNMLDKQVFVYSNSGYVPEQLRFFDVLGGKWCRSIAVEQELFRIESFDTSPVSGTESGTEEVVAGYRRARDNAARKKSTPHHTQYWFNISSDEVNLKWHNIERWSEVIRAVTIGLKQSDPNCIVSTPEINSIAMGLLEKLGENHTFEYLDLYFTTGCSLPVPPECMNKYWSFDIDALATIEERFGRRLTLTGMQYSTGNIGRAWGVHESHQATYYVRGDILRRTRDVDYISYFKFRESQNVNIYEVKDAINHADLSPKPAFVALCNNFAKLDRSTYRGRLLLGTGNYAYVFDRPSGPILALWTTEPRPQAAYLNLHSPSVTHTDLYGRERQVRTASGMLAVTLNGDVQYLEGLGAGIMEETSFEPAPILDRRDLAQRKLKEIFVTIENARSDGLNFGDSRRGGRGDLVKTAGSTFTLRANVYNFSLKPASIEVSLSLPGGLEDQTGAQTCKLEPGAATSRWFTVHVPLGRRPGLGKIRALAQANGQELDPFTTDILVRSPIQILPLEAAPKPGTPIRVRFTNPTDSPLDVRLRLALPHRWQAEKVEQKLTKVAPGQTVDSQFVLATAKADPFHRYSLAAFAESGGQEAETEARLDFAAVQPTDQPVNLDGELDEWFASGPVYCGQRSNDYIYNTLKGILDPRNFSVRFRTLYDKENLYLGLDVWDDEICEEDTKHGLLWDLDSVVLSFDVDGDGKQDEKVSVSCSGRSYISPDDPRGDREPMITGTKGLVQLASRVFHEPTASHPRGSIMELAIPWRYFDKKPFQPKPGARLGINVFCVDEDVRAWSARPWKFDEGRKRTFVPFVLGSPVEGVTPSDWTSRPRVAKKAFSRSPGDVAAFKVGEAGLVRGPYTAGNAERFPTTGLDVPDRAEAQRLWFYGPGYVEYDYDLGNWAVPDGLQALEFTAELSTCYLPGNTHYALPGNATRIMVSVAGTEIGARDLLGDPGVDGWLIRLRVTESGTFHRDKRISQVTLDSLRPQLKGKVRVRLTASGVGPNPGGLNIHGPKGSGIHGIDPSLIFVWRP